MFFETYCIFRCQENCRLEIAPQKISPYENTPLLIFPPMKALPCQNYTPEFFPRENCPLGKLPPFESPPHS